MSQIRPDSEFVPRKYTSLETQKEKRVITKEENHFLDISTIASERIRPHTTNALLLNRVTSS